MQRPGDTTKWHPRPYANEASSCRSKSVRAALEAKQDLEQGCRNKAEAFIQGLKKEYDMRHRHGRPAAAAASRHHDASNSPSSFHSNSHMNSFQHGGVESCTDQSAGCGQLQAEIEWESCKEGSSARRYQRFLEQELGQVLQAQAQALEGSSQLSERQPNWQLGFLKGQALTGTGQLTERQLLRQPRSCEGQVKGPPQSSSLGTNRLQLGHVEGQTVLSNRQSLSFEGQSRPYQHSSDRYSHANNKNFGKSEHQQLQQSIRYRHSAATTAPSCNAALPFQADSAEQRLDSVGGMINMQSRAQVDAKPASSQLSVNQQPCQPCEEQSALALVSQAREQRWQRGSGVDPEHVSMGMAPLAGDESGPQRHASAFSGDVQELSQQRPRRHVLSLMRGISPHRRQLLLQARVALFDSDSSSDEEGCSVKKDREGCHPLSKQQQPPKTAPVDQASRSEGEGGSQAWDPTPAAAAPSMEHPKQQQWSGVLSEPVMVSVASKAEPITLPAVADDSGLTQPGVSRAAAATAASAQLSQMQAQVAALERDKVQLIAQLSAAHSCVQPMRNAEALSQESANIADKTAEEDQEQRRQLASEVTKVRKELADATQQLSEQEAAAHQQSQKLQQQLFASDDVQQQLQQQLTAALESQQQLQQQLSELQKSSRHKHEQLIAANDRYVQLQQQFTAADDYAKQLLEQLGVANARADAAQLSGSALAADLGCAHTAVALKLERLVQAQAQIGQLQQHLQLSQDSAAHDSAQMAQLQLQLQLSDSRAEASQASLAVEFEALKAEYAAQSQGAVSLRQQVETLRAQLHGHEQSQQAAADMQQLLDQAGHKLACKEQLLVQLQHESTALKVELKDVHDQSQQLTQHSVSALQTQVQSLQTQLAQEQHSAAESLELREQRVVALQAEVDSLQSQLTEKQHNMTESQEMNQQLAQHKQQWTADSYDTTQQSAVTLQLKVDSLQSQVLAKQQSLSQTQWQVMSLQQQSQHAEQLESQAQTQLAEAKHALAESQRQIESLQQQLQHAEHKVANTGDRTEQTGDWAGLVKVEADLAAAQQQLQDVQQSAAHAQDLAQQSESALRSELKGAFAQQAASHTRTMQARGRATVLQEQLDHTSQKLNRHLLLAQQTEAGLKAQLEEVQQAEAARSTKLSCARREQGTLQQQVAALQQQLAAGQEYMSKQLQLGLDALSALKSDLAASQQSVSEAHTELHTAYKVKADLEASLHLAQQLKAESHDKAGKLQLQLQTATASLQEHHQAEAQLRTQLDSAQHAEAELRAELGAAQEAESDLRFEVLKAQEQQTESNAHISVLQQQLCNAREHLSNLQTLAQEAESNSRAASERALAEKQQLLLSLHQLQTQPQRCEQQIQPMSGTAGSLLHDHAQLQQQLLEAQEQARQLQQQLHEARPLPAQLEQQLHEAQTLPAQLLQQLQEAQEQSEQLQGQLLDAQEQCTQLQQQLREAQTLPGQLHHQLHDAQEECTQHQQQVHEAQDQSKQLQGQLEQAQALPTQLQLQLHEAQEQSRQLQQQLQDAQEQCTQLQQQLVGAHALPAQLQQQLQVAQEQLQQQLDPEAADPQDCTDQLGTTHVAKLDQQSAAVGGGGGDSGVTAAQKQVDSVQLDTDRWQLSESEHNVLELTSEVSQLKAQTQASQTQLAESRLKCSELESELSEASVRLRATAAELAASTAAESHQQGLLAALQSQVCALQQRKSVEQVEEEQRADQRYEEEAGAACSSCEEEEGGKEPGAVGAIVDKLWNDLQQERAARQEAEERLQEAETALLSHQASMIHLQQQSQPAVPTQLTAQALSVSTLSGTEGELQRCTQDSAESGSKSEEGLSEETAAELLSGATLQLTNPLFRQQDTEAAHIPRQIPDPNNSPGLMESADDQQISDSGLANLDHARNTDMAEGSSAISIQHLQQQVQGLRSELDTQATQLQTSEAGKEYIQRLLNAVTAEHSMLQHQVDKKQELQQSALELKQNPEYMTGPASAKVSMAEHVPQGLLGLQPATSQIPAMWLTTPSVRRSLLTEYGPAGKPYGMDGPTLVGADSIMGPYVAESYLQQRREADSKLGALPSSGVSDDMAATSKSRGDQGSSMPYIEGLEPGSGAFGAALAAAERASVNASRRVSQCLSQDGTSAHSQSRHMGVSPSKASWTSLLRWGSRHLPLVRQESESASQSDQGPQMSELIGIIERQGSHLEQYRSVLDAQRQTNASLNAGCERIQARLDQLGRRSRCTTTSDE